MPAAENKALIAQIYAAMGKGEIQPLLDHLCEDVEWTHQIDPRLARFGGTHRGIAAVERNFLNINAVMPPILIEGLEMTAEDERVSVICRIARTRPDAKAVSTRSSHHFTFRDGKIATFLEILDTAEVMHQINGSVLLGDGI